MTRGISRRALPLAIVLAAGVCGTVHAQVQFKTKPDTVRLAVPAEQTAQDLAQLAARPDKSRVVMQFARPLQDEQKAALADAGVTLLNYINDHAYFARLTPGLDAQRVLGVATPTSVRAVDTSWKLHPRIEAGEVPQWAVVGAKDAADPTVAMYVMFHADEPLDNAKPALIAGLGGRVVDEIVSIHTLVIEMPFSKARELASDDRVQWIEPALPPITELNAENRTITGVGVLQSAPYNLTGAGVTAFVYDGGRALNTHVDFQGRLSILTGDTAGLSNHATHVSGTVGGGGVANATHRGMAPGVTLLSAGLQAGSGFLYTNPGDMETDYTQAIVQGADVANNSIGTNTESNGFDCAWQGQYGVTDVLIDRIGRGGLGGPIVIVWAAGNERQGSRCDVEGFGDYYSVAPPGGAKNHIPVGALNANDDSMTSFSSWGPIDDGRLVPVVSAPGCQVGGDGGVTSTSSSSTTAYASLCGTSMASPTVCGIVALMLQDFRANNPSVADPVGSTIKAVLAHTAVDRGNPGPDYQFGYGSVRAQAAVDLMRTGAFGEATVSQGQDRTYQVSVAPSQSSLKMTLAWDDFQATANAAVTLINDLDLILVSPSGVQFNAWTLNPANPSANAVRTGPNRRDNIEQVVVDNPQAGVWTVIVRGFNVPQGPQRFSMAGVQVLPTPFVSIASANSISEPIAPGTPITIDAQMNAVNQTLIAGSQTFYYRYGSEPFTAVPMTDEGGGIFRATLPAARCGETPQWYFSAEGTSSGVTTFPATAPGTPISRTVGSVATPVNEQFATTVGGFTVTNDPALLTGTWGRAVPGNWGRGDPSVDNDPDANGFCFVTDNGNTVDVDGGPTTLTSPVYDLSGLTSPVLSYARWFSNDDAAIPAEADVFIVQSSTDGGATWSNLETATSTNSWVTRTFNVPASSQFRVRFVANDTPNNSVTEAAIDSIRISSTSCTYSCPADVDRSGDTDLTDFFTFLNWFDVNDPRADVDGVPGVDLGDFFEFLNSFDAGCL